MDMKNARWELMFDYELLVVGLKRCARVNLKPEEDIFGGHFGKHEMRCLEDEQAHATTGRGVAYYYCDSVSEAKALAETLIALLPGDRR